MNLDPEQRLVVDAEPSARLVVEACPGAGKTLVACRRVAHLIEAGAPPSSILLISFTRTAVAELRARIAASLKDVSGAANVRIATLDSQTFALLHAFPNDDDELLGGYEANITALIKRLTHRDSDIKDYLGDLSQVLIDEAQDLTGARAELALALISAVHPECGVTVFADPAQAIYGFTVDNERPEPEQPFLDRLRQMYPAFQSVRLDTVHRTEKRSLLDLFASGWAVITEPALAAPERADSVARRIEHFSERLTGEPEDSLVGGPASADTLVLFRKRLDVCIASSKLLAKGCCHRLRMSQLPLIRSPWLASVLGKCRDRRVSRPAFEDLFSCAVGSGMSGSPPVDAAFELVRRHAAAGRGIDIDQLRAALLRATPPPDLCVSEVGVSGPILGTVHASKGREAHRVRYVMAPIDTGGKSDAEVNEEARVSYVAATRARDSLELVTRKAARGARCDSGRAFRMQFQTPGVPAQVEMGIGGDLGDMFDPDAIETTHTDGQSFGALQGSLIAFDGVPVPLVAENDGPPNFVYRLKRADGVEVGRLRQSVNSDLFAVRDRRHDRSRDRKALPRSIKPVYLVATTTVVVREPGTLPFPYDVSGLCLAPVVRGLPMVYFAGRE
ncbi:MAG: UvrD-helicase domain-containing protein [Phycisphaerales bacterium]